MTNVNISVMITLIAVLAIYFLGSLDVWRDDHPVLHVGGG